MTAWSLPRTTPSLPTTGSCATRVSSSPPETHPFGDRRAATRSSVSNPESSSSAVTPRKEGEVSLRVDFPQTIQRVLAGGQVHETAGFFGLPGERLFGGTHLPAGAIHGGLVISSSIGPEQLTSYRNEVVLARRLAAAGVAVQRFHYRGSGHSDGEDVDLTLGTMVGGAAAAAAPAAEVTAVHHPS